MRSRSLAATLAIAFSAITVIVFAFAGSYVYVALSRQVKEQDDLDILLAARHTRRLVHELSGIDDIPKYAERLNSQVYGNEAMSLMIKDQQNRTILEHNASRTAAPPFTMKMIVQDPERSTDASIVSWALPDGTPVRGIGTLSTLRDGATVRIIVARDMRDRWQLLDHYRERLIGASCVGAIIAFLLGIFLVRRALQPLKVIARTAEKITVDHLDTRIAEGRVPQELQMLVQSLNKTFGNLERSFERISQYTTDLAHDMRTPLANLRGATEVTLSRERTADEYQMLLASNLEECDRLSKMIENVLFLARAEHPQFVQNRIRFDVINQLRLLADYFEGLADDAAVRIAIQGEGFLTADLELFRRAVSNLLANAIRFTPPSGTVTLSVAVDSTTVVLTVHNEGIPVAPAYLERIFDRFYRGDFARTQNKSSTTSTGLGLAIVRTVMELHGGRAHAESDPTGSRFVLTFPNTDDPTPTTLTTS